MLRRLTPSQIKGLTWNWRFQARRKQLTPPGDWTLWLLLAGRSFGKSRTGAEFIREEVEEERAKRLLLIARTKQDVRDVVLEGPSGLLTISPPWFRPRYEPGNQRLVWKNGAVALIRTAEEPEGLRGPGIDLLWADEIAAWKYQAACWSNLMFSLRESKNPRGVGTTTPRPTELIKQLVSDPTTHLTTGRTHENRSNLPPKYFADIIRQFEGTRLGRQELYAEILDDNPGALWKGSLIEETRVTKDRVPELRRVVVAIDPAVTSEEDSCETGIVVVGLGYDRNVYVLADRSGTYTPWEWANAAIKAYRDFEADLIVAEVNNGGDLVETNLRTVSRRVRFKKIWASRGKRTRAEPVAALYERKVVHHVGCLARLEHQLCGWDPSLAVRSPDRLDALVWGVTEVAGIQQAGTGRRNLSNLQRYV